MLTKPSSRAIEARAIYTAGIAAALSWIVSLIYFWGSMNALFGKHSIGEVAAIFALISSFVGFILTYTPPELRARKSWDHLRNGMKSSSLAVIHAAICLLITIVVFDLAQNAFEGLLLDQWVSALLVGLTVGVCSYGSFLIGASLTTARLSASLAIFMIAGVMVSMISADDPTWWKLHFSSLGGTANSSAWVFNLTLVIAGLVIICLSDFIVSDFQRLSQVRGGLSTRAKVNTIRGSLAAIGILLACVGIFKYDVYNLVHALSAGGMAIIFLVLVGSMPSLAPSFPKAFFLFSYATMAAVLFCIWLLKGVGYLNLTAFELICGAIIFGWVIVFVRNLAVAETENA